MNIIKTKKTYINFEYINFAEITEKDGKPLLHLLQGAEDIFVSDEAAIEEFQQLEVCDIFQAKTIAPLGKPSKVRLHEIIQQA